MFLSLGYVRVWQNSPILSQKVFKQMETNTQFHWTSKFVSTPLYQDSCAGTIKASLVQTLLNSLPIKSVLCLFRFIGKRKSIRNKRLPKCDYSGKNITEEYNSKYSQPSRVITAGGDIKNHVRAKDGLTTATLAPKLMTSLQAKQRTCGR